MKLEVRPTFIENAPTRFGVYLVTRGQLKATLVRLFDTQAEADAYLEGLTRVSVDMRDGGWTGTCPTCGTSIAKDGDR